VHTTGSFVLANSLRRASAARFSLARRPSSNTGCLALLISRAAAVIASAYAGPGGSGAVGGRTSPSPLASMIYLGALMKAAPGRPDLAARKAFATTSETEFGDSISAENFMIGRNRSTVSIL